MEEEKDWAYEAAYWKSEADSLRLRLDEFDKIFMSVNEANDIIGDLEFEVISHKVKKGDSERVRERIEKLDKLRSHMNYFLTMQHHIENLTLSLKQERRKTLSLEAEVDKLNKTLNFE